MGEKYGYIDREGQVVIKPKFSGYGNFSEGLALISLGKRRQGYIDKTGQIVIPLAESSEGGDFSECLAPVTIRAGLAACGYIDKTGKMVMQANFVGCYGFSEGLAVVHLNDATLNARYIDNTGHVVISTSFSRVSAFRGALAPVYDGGFGVADRGYIVRSGKVVWKPIHRNSPVLY